MSVTAAQYLEAMELTDDSGVHNQCEHGVLVGGCVVLEESAGVVVADALRGRGGSNGAEKSKRELHFDCDFCTE